MKILVKKVDSPLEVAETDKKYFGDCARSFIGEGETIERVYLDGFQFIMGVNENGLPQQLPINFLMEFDNPAFPIQTIVGDVIFVRCQPCNPFEEEIWDFEVTDVTDEDLKRIERMLDPREQYRLMRMYLL